MQRPEYYRAESARARRLLANINHPEMRATLARMARDYEHIAEDLERGLVEVKHPERLPQQR